MDLGFATTLNPDDQDITLRFTFKGLGDVTQRIGLGGDKNGG